MDTEARIRVRTAHWPSDTEVILALRTAVFVDEQRVPPEDEIDGRDPDSLHVVAETHAGTVIGTGRLLPEGRIGRMAVASDWRGRGVGRLLLRALIEEARARGIERVTLHAQVTAIGFYERSGFAAHGPVCDDAGIAHRAMSLELGTATP